MEQLIEHIQRFNRKERFILVGQALGNPSFVLGREFKTKLADCLQRAIPDDAYCAMDYHLDWLLRPSPGRIKERVSGVRFLEISTTSIRKPPS